MSQKPSIPTAILFFAIVLTTSVLATLEGPLHLMLWTTIPTVFLLGLGALAYCSPSLRRTTAMSAFFILLSTGIVLLHDRNHAGDHRLNEWLGESREYAEIEARVLDGPIFHERGISFDAELLTIDIDPDGELTRPPPKVRVFYATDNIDTCARLPLPGDQFTTWGRLERFAPSEVSWRSSQRRLMEGRGYTARISLLEPLAFVDPIESNQTHWLSAIKRPLTIHRIQLERRVNEFIKDDAYALATAMLTGSRGELRPELREPFDITSTGHILAISGLHFAVIAALVAFCLQLLLNRFPRIYRRWPRRMVIGLITAAILLAYLLAIGAPISARRAFGMTLLAIVIICFSPWRLRPLSALAATAGLLLLLQPSLVREVGFQLSVAATGGICLFIRFRPNSLRPPDLQGPETESRISRWRRGALTFGGISIAATVATWPPLLAMTGEIPIAGLWTNLIIVPLVSSIIFPVLVAGALATSIAPWIADLLLTLSTDALLLIHAGLDQVAYWPGTVYRWGTPSMLETTGFSLAAIAAIAGGLRLRAVAIAAALIALFSIPGILAKNLEEPTVRLHFIPVGQGDATLIELPDNTTILVDAGGRPMGSDPGLQNVVPYLRHRGIHRLDALILSHGDFDHYGGMSAVARPFSPRRFYVDADEKTPRVIELIANLQAQGTEIKRVSKEHRIKTDDLSVHIHRPPLPDADPNDRSLVVSFSYAALGVLLPGDLETDGELWLVDHIYGRRALMKVPHHGSRTSSSDELLDHLRPAVAVSSSGRHNRFGHPHLEVVERYEERGIDLFRTDLDGAVVVEITRSGRMVVTSVR